MKLIGIYGRARSGKDTAATYLAEKLRLHQYSFASPLKDMLTSVFGDHFYTGDRERICPETGVSYRAMMQTLGTEWGRAINPDIWVNLVAKRWEYVQQGKAFSGTNKAKGMVLSDVRFDSEAEWIIDNGGMILEITRSEAPEIKGVPMHASEHGIKDRYVHATVENNKDLPALYRELDHIANFSGLYYGR